MATYRQPNEEETVLLQKIGKSPDNFVIDDAGNAVEKSTANGWTDDIAAFAKGAGRGARDLVANAIKYPGTVADALREKFGDAGSAQVTDDKRSILTQAGEALGHVGDSFLAENPDDQLFTGRRIASRAGEFAGGLGAMVVPGTVAGRIGSALGLTAGITAGAENVGERANALAEARGEQPTAKNAAVHGTAYIPFALLLNKWMAEYGPQGASLLWNRLTTKAVKEGIPSEVLAVAGKEALQGAVAGATDEAAQQLTSGEIGAGKGSVGQIAGAALGGAIGQGAMGALAHRAASKVNPELVNEPAGEAKAKADAEAFAQAQTTEAQSLDEAALQKAKDRDLRIQARLAAQSRGEKLVTLNETPVDTAFNEMMKKGIPTDVVMQDRLEQIYDDNPANKDAVFAEARRMIDQGLIDRPSKPVKTPEMVQKQMDELAAIDDKYNAVTKRAADIQKAQQDRAEKATSTPPAANAGDVWLKLEQERAATEQGELQQLQQQAQTLLEQRKLILGSGNVEQPGPRPVATQATLDANNLPITQRGSVEGEAAGMLPMEQQTGAPLAGGEARPGIKLPERMPVEPTQPVPPQEERTSTMTGEIARQQDLERRVTEAEARVKALTREQPVAATEPQRLPGQESTVAERGRLEQTRGASERSAINEALGELAAEQPGRPPIKRPPESAVPKEVRDYLEGKLIPGMEGEQSHPFSGERPTDDPLTTVHAVFGPSPELLKSVFKPVVDWWNENSPSRKARDVSPVHVLSLATRSNIHRLAERGPIGTYLLGKLDSLFIEQSRMRSEFVNRLAEIEKRHNGLLQDERVIKWLNDMVTNKKRDMSTLPADRVRGVTELLDFVKSFHDLQRSLGVKVMERGRDGIIRFRDPIDLDYYMPFGLNPDVYRAMEEGGKRWAQYEKDWTDHYTKENGTAEGASETLAAWRRSFAQARYVGGEPLFQAVRLEAGKSLPESWRSKNLHDSALSYIHNFASDLAWAKVIQSDALTRRAFGITHDPQGNRMLERDMKTQPTRAQWEAILERADRMDLRWRDTFKPGDALDQPISGHEPFGLQLYHNYTQRPMSFGRLGKVGEGLNQIASAVMMQHTSAIRNIAQSGSTVLDYALSKDIGSALHGLVDAFSRPNEVIAESIKAGAQDAEANRHEMADAITTGLWKTARGYRQYTGLEWMNRYAKALAFNVAREAVKTQVARHGPQAPLLREFGPLERIAAGENPAQFIDQAAAVIANHADPRFDARSLPASLTPQSRGFIGNLMRLQTWSVARFNHWYTDAYLPMVKQGDYSRMLKSLFLGTLGAVGTQQLISWLGDRMPADLTAKEWLKLDDDEKRKEFAPMLFTYLQTQGSMGILGDIASASAKAMAGKDISRSMDLSRPMIPGLMIGQQAKDTVWDFVQYARNERGWSNVDATDYLKLAIELAKLQQTARVVMNRGDAWLPERLRMEAEEGKIRREKAIYESVTGRSPSTGNLRADFGATGQLPMTPNAFSLQKEFDIRTGPEFEALGPSLALAAEKGWAPRTARSLMNDKFYEDVVRRRGSSVAEQVLAHDIEKEKDRPYKRAVAHQYRLMTNERD